MESENTLRIVREGRQGWREESGKRETKGAGVLARVVFCSTAVCVCVCVCVCVSRGIPDLRNCFQKHWWLCDKLLPHTHTNPKVSMVHMFAISCLLFGHACVTLCWARMCVCVLALLFLMTKSSIDHNTHIGKLLVTSLFFM